MSKTDQSLHALRNTPPWDWPEDAGATFLAVLRNPQAPPADRLVAAELAGDFVVLNDEMAEALLSVLRNRAEADELRGQTAISLGPALESADTAGYGDEELAEELGGEDETISERTFNAIRAILQELYADADVPDEVRRRVLEASVRAPRDWHRDAIRAALRGDENWQLTAVFCMQYVKGFEREILEALDSDRAEVVYEAVCAAGNWVLDAAFPHVTELATSGCTEKGLRLAAIAAVGNIRPHETLDVLGELMDSDDEDIAEAVADALALADGDGSADDDDEDDDDGPKERFH